jgi:hypothetical protein
MRVRGPLRESERCGPGGSVADIAAVLHPAERPPHPNLLPARGEKEAVLNDRRTTMPSWRNKPSGKQDYLKRRTYEQGKAQIDAAHKATFRLYADALRLWRRCTWRRCKRHRRCIGDPTQCFMRALPFVQPSRRRRAQQQVNAGGPRCIALASHVEWTVRRTEIKELVSWVFG